MTKLLVNHTVEDFDRWKPFYDQHAGMRKSSGSTGAKMYRSAHDPNQVVLMFDWDSLENAQNFVASDDLREVMGQAGVVGRPDIYFLEEVEDSEA